MHVKHLKVPLTSYKETHAQTHMYIRILPQSVDVWLQKVFPCPPPEKSIETR